MNRRALVIHCREFCYWPYAIRFVVTSMARGDLCENLLCLLALGIGFVVAIPLALTQTGFGGKCLLFGEADLLTRTVSGGNAIYCQYGIYSSSANVVLAAFLVFFRWCCVIRTVELR